MNKKILPMSFVILVSFLVFTETFAGSVARIEQLTGNVSVLKKGAEKWRAGRMNMPLNVGDALYSKEESIVEIVFVSGAILRMDENTKVTITEETQKGIKTETSLGNVWANMRKLVATKNEFEVATPIAVCAVRGTVFQTATKQDSSTDVSVFEGKVSVKPGSRKDEKKAPDTQGRHEIPGPHEVSLEQWLMIVAGQMISIDRQGVSSEKKIDMEKVKENIFVKKNLAWDEALEQKLQQLQKKKK